MFGGNVGKIILMVIGVVIVCLMFPLVMDGVVSVTGHANIADFTGLEQFANITPLLLWLGIIGGMGFLGFNMYKSSRSGGRKKASRRG